ncbi:hypothetical protein L484_002069 [Morus notabilis]|uniref:KIB1-4 beta-propeller domain-containing protein n=2 Tax=Morus notabilis TaxID=981085 RepID=W9SPL7_9ROSA|nr:hypothetical protein L484_002069 [Morus notabilis]
MVIFNPENQVAFTGVPGDGEWIWISNPGKLLFRDISYLRGQDQVYALCDDGSLVRIEFAFHNISGKMSSTVNELVKLMEFSGPLSAKVELIAAHPIGESVGPLPEMERTGRAYLVASPDDDLFGVFRYSEDMGSDQRTAEFAVYKFNPRGVGWESVISIRDKAFFVGNNTSWSIFSANTVNCRKNRIYFTDDNWELEWLHNIQGLDIGVYDMETRRTEGLGFGVSTSTSSLVRSTWITPGLTPNAFR